MQFTSFFKNGVAKLVLACYRYGTQPVKKGNFVAVIEVESTPQKTSHYYFGSSLLDASRFLFECL